MKLRIGLLVTMLGLLAGCSMPVDGSMHVTEKKCVEDEFVSCNLECFDTCESVLLLHECCAKCCGIR